MGRARDRWMPLNWGDYLKDTGHLTTEQHGAYMLLIAHYWTTGALPNDDRQLAQVAKLKPQRWRLHRPVLRALFRHRPKAPRNWWHKRVEEEIAEAAKKHAQAKEAAEERWRLANARKADSDTETTDATAHAERGAEAMPRPQGHKRTRGTDTTAAGEDRGSTRKDKPQSREHAGARDPAAAKIAAARATVAEFLDTYWQEGDLTDSDLMRFRDQANRATTVDAIHAVDSAAVDLISERKAQLTEDTERAEADALGVDTEET